jgi:hypothetical protein
MNETIDIPIIYKGKELIFKAKVVKFGYIHRFEVEVDGYSVIFEPDEERNYRVILNPVDDKNSKIDLELLKQISETLQSLS